MKEISDISEFVIKKIATPLKIKKFCLQKYLKLPLPAII